MGNWTPSVTLDPIPFDGDQIIFTSHRIQVDDMVTLSKNMTIEKDGEVKISFSESMEVCKVASEILPKALVNVEGMTLGDNTPVNLEKFCELVSTEFYFIPLVGDLLKALMDISSVSEEEEAN